MLRLEACTTVPSLETNLWSFIIVSPTVHNSNKKGNHHRTICPSHPKYYTTLSTSLPYPSISGPNRRGRFSVPHSRKASSASFLHAQCLIRVFFFFFFSVKNLFIQVSENILQWNLVDGCLYCTMDHAHGVFRRLEMQWCLKTVHLTENQGRQCFIRIQRRIRFNSSSTWQTAVTWWYPRTDCWQWTNSEMLPQRWMVL